MADQSIHPVPTLVTVSGRLAQFCDRAEHNESADRAVIADAGAALRKHAHELLVSLSANVLDSYESRLVEIEQRSPLFGAASFDASEAVSNAKTWRQLQRCQALHDSAYHPDVAGLSKFDQLRHYTQHLSKLAWYFQDQVDRVGIDPDTTVRRATDILVFGVKLATVCGQLLPDEPIESVA